MTTMLELRKHQVNRLQWEREEMEAEIARLRAENERLGTALERVVEGCENAIDRLRAENAKLRAQNARLIAIVAADGKEKDRLSAIATDNGNQVAKLRAALEAVSRYFPDDTSSSIGKLVRAALEETQ